MKFDDKNIGKKGTTVDRLHIWYENSIILDTNMKFDKVKNKKNKDICPAPMDTPIIYIWIKQQNSFIVSI